MLADFKGRDWYKRSFRRNLIDMHIEDWNEEFLSKFEPERYVEMLKISQTQVAMIYANSHVGYCYWPTKNGAMHKNLKGRDIFGEILNLCKKENIIPLAYYTVIFDNWAYENNPSWRMLDIDGKPSRERRSVKEDVEYNMKIGRYGNCCPNSEGYREFTVKQLEELVSSYDFKGIFIDMTFWPIICFCDSCKKRFHDECKSDIPTIIDWKNPRWLTFQRKREEWMNEFALLVKNTIKKIKPDVTIENQFSPAPFSWTFGVTEEIGNISDYAGGDFYGGFEQQSFICKFYYNLTPNQPFEYMTAVSDSNLTEETTLKSDEMLKMHNYIAMAHNGAFLFIGAIDPIGTLDVRSFKRMNEVFGETKRYEPYLGGNMIQDVAVYFSFSSKLNFNENGSRAQIDWTERNKPEFIYTHLNSVLGASKILRENHIPFGIISKNQIKKLADYKILVLSNILFLNKEELEEIYKFVEDGGSLYASGEIPKELLEKIFAIKYLGITKENITYMVPTDESSNLLYDTDKDNPMTIRAKQVMAKSNGSGKIIAKLVLPYTDPSDETKFSSIHSNPPGITTDCDSIVYKEVGKGKAIWVSHPIEKIDKIPHKKTFINLIRTIYSRSFSFSSDVSHVVEIIAFVQTKNNRYIINLINEQNSLPPIPVYDFKITLNTNGKDVKKITSITYDEKLKFIEKDGYIEIVIPKLELFNMITVDFK
jgi:hypothetical protein